MVSTNYSDGLASRGLGSAYQPLRMQLWSLMDGTAITAYILQSTKLPRVRGRVEWGQDRSGVPSLWGRWVN